MTGRWQLTGLHHLFNPAQACAASAPPRWSATGRRFKCAECGLGPACRVQMLGRLFGCHSCGARLPAVSAAVPRTANLLHLIGLSPTLVQSAAPASSLSACFNVNAGRTPAEFEQCRRRVVGGRTLGCRPPAAELHGQPRGEERGAGAACPAKRRAARLPALPAGAAHPANIDCPMH